MEQGSSPLIPLRGRLDSSDPFGGSLVGSGGFCKQVKFGLGPEAAAACVARRSLFNQAALACDDGREWWREFQACSVTCGLPL
jgi:hypothetical protein